MDSSTPFCKPNSAPGSGDERAIERKAIDMSRGIAIALGVLSGGLLGAVARPAVVYVFCLRNADVDLSQGIMVLSAGFGFVVGVLAVLFSALLRDAVPSAVVGVAVGAF